MISYSVPYEHMQPITNKLYPCTTPPIADKELLRKAAADAMKAVELRALNLLEGGVGGALGARGGVRGTPMAACRAVGAPGAVPIAAAAGPPLNLQGSARSEPILRTDGLGGSGSSAGAP